MNKTGEATRYNSQEQDWWSNGAALRLQTATRQHVTSAAQVTIASGVIKAKHATSWDDGYQRYNNYLQQNGRATQVCPLRCNDNHKMEMQKMAQQATTYVCLGDYAPDLPLRPCAATPRLHTVTNRQILVFGT